MPLFYIKIIKFQQFFSCCLDAVVGASIAIGVVGKQQGGGLNYSENSRGMGAGSESSTSLFSPNY